MMQWPTFSNSELTLMLELLQAEHRQLPSEIHHTDSRAMVDDLHARKKLVDSAIAHVQQALTGEAVGSTPD